MYIVMYIHVMYIVMYMFVIYIYNIVNFMGIIDLYENNRLI